MTFVLVVNVETSRGWSSCASMPTIAAVIIAARRLQTGQEVFPQGTGTSSPEGSRNRSPRTGLGHPFADLSLVETRARCARGRSCACPPRSRSCGGACSAEAAPLMGWGPLPWGSTGSCRLSPGLHTPETGGRAGRFAGFSPERRTAPLWGPLAVKSRRSPSPWCYCIFATRTDVPGEPRWRSRGLAVDRRWRSPQAIWAQSWRYSLGCDPALPCGGWLSSGPARQGAARGGSR